MLAPNEMPLKKTLILASTITLAMLTIDQVSKWAMLTIVMQPPRVIHVAPVFNLTLGFNSGISFGLFRETFAEWPVLLILLKLVIVTGLLAWAILSRSAMEVFGLSMMAGGALGNTVDRWRQGAVTDFMDLHWQGWHWPTFNIADIAITLGAGLLLISAVRSTHDRTVQRAKEGHGP